MTSIYIIFVYLGALGCIFAGLALLADYFERRFPE